MDSSRTGKNVGPEAGPAFADSANADSANADHAARAVATLADDIGRGLAVARVLAQQGRELALNGLDQRVGVLCAQTLDLAPADARAMRPRLAALLAELDALHMLLGGAP